MHRAAVAQGRNPQKFVALKMCPIAAAAKMGFPLEVEGHLSCSILVVPPPRRRQRAVSSSSPGISSYCTTTIHLSKLLFLKPTIS